ncbi:Glycine dehydrogenase (decarboxylating) [Trema orientale]|uniref:Glycine dehydrogenase (Decarboxylating) n=1 Tax=Trema orientale TaxID=63057 RepID=A0A2P5D2Z6_TREOI|nr:Glycine dehydrogenase (decarboxylating) [Trema orientale]
MNSPCLREASEACFHGCCPAPALALQSPKSTAKSTSTITASTSQHHFTLATLSSLPNTSTQYYYTNHESLPSLEESFSYFIKAYPQYSQTHQADQLRSQEYYHLNHVCLDYIGYGLFSYSQQRRRFTPTAHDPAMASSSSLPPPLPLDFPESHFFDICYKAVSLKSQVVFNSTSQEPELESKLRKRIMAFMNISEEDYTMVFTSNQSSAFKLISDSYPFHSNRNLLTVYDFKSEAVEAMTESSKRKGARVNSAEFSWPRMRIQTRKLRKMITSSSSSRSNKKKLRQNRGLFVFPLQSRMTGSRYSYLWMSLARENGWHVLLDACALGPKDMETLGLSLFQPDFLICSFYKVFGENPSGFGCLFVKKTSSSILKESGPSTCIGVVSLVPPPSSSSASTSDKQNPETSVKNDDECRGLDHADTLGLVLISTRARFLINWLVYALTRLHHPNSENGLSLVRIYGPNVGYDRGPSVAFNVFDWKGEKVDPALVQKLADRNNISLSFGFLQQFWFEDKNEEEKEKRLETCGGVVIKTTTEKEAKGTAYINKERDKSVYEQCGISAVTATIGLMTNFEDVYRLWAFVARFLDADFVEKERWRYLALNQTTIEV